MYLGDEVLTKFKIITNGLSRMVEKLFVSNVGFICCKIALKFNADVSNSKIRKLHQNQTVGYDEIPKVA
jgi:hypothetical protein